MAKKQKIGYQPIDNAYTRDIDAWFIILMTLVLFPVGVWLMWTRTSWKRWVKVLVTVLVALLFLLRIVGGIYQSTVAPPSADAETTAAAVRALCSALL